MLSQLLYLMLAPLFVLTTLGVPPPGRTPERVEPLAREAKLRLKPTEGGNPLQGWDRPEVVLVAECQDGSVGEKSELEVRAVPAGMEIEIRVPRHRFLIGLHRSPRSWR
jgi:hypothetical protein